MAVDLSIFQSRTAQALWAEGHSDGLAEALLVVLGGRGVDISDEARDRITSCPDHDTLTTWLTRAATATTTAELFEQPEQELAQSAQRTNSAARRSIRRPSCQVPSGPRSYCRMMPTGLKPTLV